MMRVGSLNKCGNPACVRLVKEGIVYCCQPCSVAHTWRYDPDGYHSSMCDERAAKRVLEAGE